MQPESCIHPLYLLDAGILINAQNQYYPLSRVPEFWAWLIHKGEAGQVKVPGEIWQEIQVKEDALALWTRQPKTEAALLFEEKLDQNLAEQVMKDSYFIADPADDKLDRMGADPYLISYGLADPDKRVIATTEKSKPRARGANRKVPDLCTAFGIRSINAFALIQELDFRTSWQSWP